MQVEQAVFTSIRGSHRQGYHLVSKSPGVDEALAQSLTLWCPTHAALLTSDPADCSLNYFPAGNGWLALTRTVLGGPEYSGRGGLQVVTVVLLLRAEQLDGYGGDPLRMMRLALALGHLRLPASWPPQLPWVDLPESSYIGENSQSAKPTLSQYLLDKTSRLLRDQQRVALLNVADREAVLEHLLSQLTKRQRLGLSFTTGLKPSMHRPFALHILPSDDLTLRQHLATQEVYCLR